KGSLTDRGHGVHVRLRLLKRLQERLVEIRLDDVVRAGDDACFLLGRAIARLADEIITHVLWPARQVIVREPGRPAAPEQRPAADAVGEAGEALVADPGHPPDHVLGAVVACPETVGSTDFPADP